MISIFIVFLEVEANLGGAGDQTGRELWRTGGCRQGGLHRRHGALLQERRHWIPDVSNVLNLFIHSFLAL